MKLPLLLAIAALALGNARVPALPHTRLLPGSSEVIGHRTTELATGGWIVTITYKGGRKASYFVPPRLTL